MELHRDTDNTLLMSPKQRVLAALKHRPTDRIPLDVCHGFFEPGALGGLLGSLLQIDAQALYYQLGADLRWIAPSYVGPDLMLAEMQDTRTLLEFHYEGYDDQRGYRPLQRADTLADVERFGWPSAAGFNYSVVAALADLYHDFAVLAPARWNPLFCTLCKLTGFETALTKMATQPAIVEAIVERIAHYYYEFGRLTLEAGQGKIDIFYIGDDVAGQESLLFSPAMWRRYFKRPLARILDMAHSFSVYVMFHSCGAIRPLIPDLIDIGVDILMPLQTTAAGMEPRELKREFGRDLSFYGGVDTQRTLPHGTEDDVRAEVRERIDVLGAGGGYIMAGSHSILPDVPLRNVLAMYDEAKRYHSARWS